MRRAQGRILWGDGMTQPMSALGFWRSWKMSSEKPFIRVKLASAQGLRAGEGVGRIQTWLDLRFRTFVMKVGHGNAGGDRVWPKAGRKPVLKCVR